MNFPDKVVNVANGCRRVFYLYARVVRDRDQSEGKI